MARAVLRNPNVAQAGFRADAVLGAKAVMNPPLLYLEGIAHHQQRRRFARLFSPRLIDTQYKASFEELAERLVEQVRTDKRADMSALAAAMSSQVVARIAGLPRRCEKSLVRRVDGLFVNKPPEPGWRPRQLLSVARGNAPVIAFFLAITWPAIRARKKAPGDDMISHLLGQGRTAVEILTECVTIATAGIVTTREFISLAAWQLLSKPKLAAEYLAGNDAERAAILCAILRLDPVLTHLWRRATADFEVVNGRETHRIPRGALIKIHIHDINSRIAARGQSDQLQQGGEVGDGVRPEALSFGDGHHRCLGAYLAILEADILLSRLLRVPGLRVVKPPRVGWNEVADTFELRDFLLAID